MQAPCSPLPADSQKLQRAAGALRLQIGLRDGNSVLRSLYQQAPCRALMPDRAPEGPFEAVLVNSSGGLVGGDTLAVEIDIAPDAGAPGSAPGLVVRAIVKVTGQTGVEMEALTAVSVACLTVYDMIKAVERGAVIGGIRLIEKRGGKSGHYRAGEA